METPNEPDKLSTLYALSKSAPVIMCALLILRKVKGARGSQWFFVSYKELKNLTGYANKQTIWRGLNALDSNEENGIRLGSKWIVRSNFYDPKKKMRIMRVSIVHKHFI